MPHVVDLHVRDVLGVATVLVRLSVCQSNCILMVEHTCQSSPQCDAMCSNPHNRKYSATYFKRVRVVLVVARGGLVVTDYSAKPFPHGVRCLDNKRMLSICGVDRTMRCVHVFHCRSYRSWVQ